MKNLSIFFFFFQEEQKLFFMGRQTSLDILRIYATFNVVVIHCTMFKYYSPIKKHPFNTIVLYLLCKPCNYLFMLISGYIGLFVTYRISQVLNIVIETSICSLFSVVFIQCFFLELIPFSSIKWSYYLTPVAHNIYWYPAPFIFTQLLFYFIHPTIKQMSIHKYIKFASIILFMLLVHEFGYYINIGLSSTRYNISSFMISFFLCPLIYNWKDKVEKYSVLILIVGFIYNYLVHYFEFPNFRGIFLILNMFFDYNLFEIPSLFLSLSMLFVALSIKSSISYGNIIQTIAELSYGTYLFGLGKHMKYYWAKRLDYVNDFHTFSNLTFCMSIKSFICLSFIAFVESKFTKLLIYRRKYFSIFKMKLDS